jgi:hypothetical protein
MIDSEQIHRNIRTLLNRLGNYTKCPACQTEMWWITHKNGKKAPYTVDAVVHFNECKAAEGFGQAHKRSASDSEQPAPDKRSTDSRTPAAAPSQSRN